jgi:hypothetical protein
VSFISQLVMAFIIFGLIALISIGAMLTFIGKRQRDGGTDREGESRRNSI